MLANNFITKQQGVSARSCSCWVRRHASWLRSKCRAAHVDDNVLRLGRGQCVELFMVTATSCDIAEVNMQSCSWWWQCRATWLSQCVELFMVTVMSCDMAKVSAWSCSWWRQRRATWPKSVRGVVQWQWQRCATCPRSVCGVVHGDGNIVRVGWGKDSLPDGWPFFGEDGILDDLVARRFLVLEGTVQALQQSAVHEQPLQGEVNVSEKCCLLFSFLFCFPLKPLLFLFSFLDHFKWRNIGGKGNNKNKTIC